MQKPAKLFKSHSRALAENETHRLSATLNSANSSGSSFGALTTLNDEILAANQDINKTLPYGTVAMVIPLAGALICHFTGHNPQIVVPGEAFTYYNHKEGILSIKNPYKESPINFLYITFSATIPAEVLLPKDFLIASANLTVQNQFHKLFESFQNGLSSHIGIFNNHTTTVYNPNNKANGIFAFVISGTFEVQGGLIEERDGIALWEKSEIEIKAMSENAIVLLIETP